MAITLTFKIEAPESQKPVAGGDHGGYVLCDFSMFVVCFVVARGSLC
jgi:hypothetical protein